jgi:hypothetical protein
MRSESRLKRRPDIPGNSSAAIERPGVGPVRTDARHTNGAPIRESGNDR